MRLAYLLAALAFGTIATASCWAECMPQEQIHAVSANALYQLDIICLPEPKFTVQRAGQVIAAGPLQIAGHHLSAFVNDTGTSFVLQDLYDGLAVYDAQGQRLGNFASESLLTWREQWIRPGSWACHPEGQWMLEGTQPTFLAGGTAVEVLTHTKRAIVFDLASGEIDRADTDYLQLALFATLTLVVFSTVGLWSFAKLKQVVNDS